MTPKQTLFVQEYLVDANATQAAIRAGYSARTARKIGTENLSKPVISEAIDKAMIERAARTGITADRVVQELANLAFFDPADIYTSDGALKPITDIPPAARSAIAGLEINELHDSDGQPIGRAVKLRLIDRLGALDKLMRHLGQYQDKVTLKGDAENPLTLLVKAVQGSEHQPARQIAEPRPLRLILISDIKIAIVIASPSTSRRRHQMPAVTIRNLSDEAHRALKVRAAHHGRSTEAEIRDILEEAVRPANRLRIGSAMAALSREAGLTNADFEALEQSRDRTPAVPMSFE